MKHFHLLLLLCLSFTLASCPDDEEPPQNFNDPGALVAKINNQTVDFSRSPDAVFGTYQSGNNGEVIDALFIRGASPNNAHEIDLTLLNFDGPGMYQIGGPGSNFVYYQYVPGGNGQVFSFASTEELGGVINVTSYNGTTIKGTFNLVAMGIDDPEETRTISEGTFDLETRN